MKGWPGWETVTPGLWRRSLPFVDISVIRYGPRRWFWSIRNRRSRRRLASGDCKRKSMALRLAESIGSDYNTDAECEVRS